jgi:uncharacterized protein (TIGR02611 family)
VPLLSILQTAESSAGSRTSYLARIRHAVRIVAGFVLILAGLVLALPGVPGPGLAIAVLGLALLAPHFEWAQRLLDWGKHKLEQARQRVRSKRTAPGA